MTTTPIHQVDAFTDVAFRGNPAAVCLLADERPRAWLQAVAAEMNLSETAFLWPAGDAWRLRWFTPAVEVPLCGHATLASAHVLWETARAKPAAEIVFETLSGRLAAAQEEGWIRLDFPTLPPRAGAVAPPPGLLAALGLTPSGQASVPAKPPPEGKDLGPAGSRVYEVPRPDASDGPSWLVELGSEAALAALRPDFGALAAVPGHAVIATARGELRDRDFVSRFFAPKAGVDEDPVTGSAHCSLAPFWCERLGRSALVGVQLSRRTGVVRVRRAGDRVHLLGQAITVLRGELSA